MRKGFDEVLKYTEYAIKTIGQKSMTDEEKDFFIKETRHNFDTHINPGFLEYRKSAGADDHGDGVDGKRRHLYRSAGEYLYRLSRRFRRIQLRDTDTRRWSKLSRTSWISSRYPAQS